MTYHLVIDRRRFGAPRMAGREPSATTIYVALYSNESRSLPAADVRARFISGRPSLFPPRLHPTNFHLNGLFYLAI